MTTSYSFSLLFIIIRIWRKEKHLKNCPVHFFTTHFYTALSACGPNRVTSWTATKKINVFRKKFILIPVNDAFIHWSLCCVVNPGAILKNVKTLNEDPSDDEPYPCILVFDSMMMSHTMAENLAINVREWLNSEWTRLGKATKDIEREPFQTDTMHVHQPKGEKLGFIG
jgi:Ulp1 family protease